MRDPEESPIRFYFFDTSAILRLVFYEPGAKKVREIFRTAGCILTSWVLLSEAMGVLKGYHRKGILHSDKGTTYQAALKHLFYLIDIDQLSVVDIDEKDGIPRLRVYSKQMLEMLEKHPELDAADALQLAVTKESFMKHLEGPSKPPLVTADKKLGKAAVEEGMDVILVNTDEDFSQFIQSL